MKNLAKALKLTGLLLTSVVIISLTDTRQSISQNTEAFLGSPKANVTVIEYGSLTCSHCADFSNTVFPQLKKQYIDTGKVKFIYRAYPTQPLKLANGLHVIADCETGAKRYALIEAFYKNQPTIMAKYTTGGVLNYLYDLSKATTGITEPQLKVCLEDSQRKANLQGSVIGAESMGISSTPTLLINGKILTKSEFDPYTMSIIAPAIDKELKLQTKKTK